MRVTTADIDESATLHMGTTGYVLTLRTGLVSSAVLAVLARVLHRI